MDNLYYSVHPFKNEASKAFLFDENVLKDALIRIYEKKFNPMTEIDRGLFEETWKVFNQATDEGYGIRTMYDPDYDFYQQLKYNNAVFSAFRTHRLQNDIATQLVDEKGKLKSFERFAEDVAPITDHNVKHWLRTEYDTAVLRAHQAADWEQFRRVKDILPNLRWMPTTSITPDLVHKQYWSIRLTLPQEHPFWSSHRPGDRWNCKCSLEATDDPITGKELIPHEEDRPDPGLDNNPGIDGKVFSDTHPYIKDAGKGAKKAVENFISENIEKPLSLQYVSYKKYKNGGEVLIHELVEKKDDYKALLTVANQLAKEGNIVKLTPSVHFKSEAYKEIYGSLIGTIYERKCPDLKVGDLFYELESFIPPFKKEKISHMIKKGTKQSSRIIINNNRGASDRYIKRNIYERLADNNFKYDIEEVWVYEKGKVRLLFKKQ